MHPCPELRDRVGYKTYLEEIESTAGVIEQVVIEPHGRPFNPRATGDWVWFDTPRRAGELHWPLYHYAKLTPAVQQIWKDMNELAPDPAIYLSAVWRTGGVLLILQFNSIIGRRWLTLVSHGDFLKHVPPSNL